MINFKEKYNNVKELIEIILKFMNRENTNSFYNLFKNDPFVLNRAEINIITNRLKNDIKETFEEKFKELNYYGVSVKIKYFNDLWINPTRIIINIHCHGKNYILSFTNYNKVQNDFKFILYEVEYYENDGIYYILDINEEDFKYLNVEFQPFTITPMTVKQTNEETKLYHTKKALSMTIPIDFDLFSEEFENFAKEADKYYLDLLSKRYERGFGRKIKRKENND